MNFKSQLLDFSSYEMTEQSKESLYNYFVYGLEPGGFMTAVLSNDLYGASARADFVNTKLMAQYAQWLVNRAPYGSYGSAEMVRGWLGQNEYFVRFQKDLVAERLRTPESALNDPLF
jgi:hypothetical protein